MVDLSPNVYKPVRLVVNLASFLYTLNIAVDSDIPFVLKYKISVLASDTVRPNAAHTTTIIPIIPFS